MTLEDLGYKLVEEEESLSQIRVRYEKDITLYEVNGYIIPKDITQYRCKTILIFNVGVSCCIGISLNSFKHAREYSVEKPLKLSCYLTWKEMKAIAEMREKGKFLDLGCSIEKDVSQQEETLEDFISYKLGYRITAQYVKKSYGSVEATLYIDYQEGVTKAVTQSRDNTSLNTDDWMIANNNVLKDIEEINKWVEERKRLSQ